MREIDRILAADKNKYLPIIILCYYSIIQRMVEDRTTNSDDDFVIFHTVFWEVKGQLTNKQTMEGLICKNFDVDAFHQFMYSRKE